MEPVIEKWSEIVEKVKINLFTVWWNLAVYGTFLKVNFLQKLVRPHEAQGKIKRFSRLKETFWGNLFIRRAIIGIWLFAPANILHVFSREIYVQCSSNQDKNGFQALKELLKGICYSKMVQNRQKVNVNPLTFSRNLAILGTFFKVHFLEKYTCNEAQTKIKTLFKAERTFFHPFKKITKCSKSSKSYG